MCKEIYSEIFGCHIYSRKLYVTQLEMFFPSVHAAFLASSIHFVSALAWNSNAFTGMQWRPQIIRNERPYEGISVLLDSYE